MADEINPLYQPPSESVELTDMKTSGFAALFNDASLTLRSTYYGRARSQNNHGRGLPKDAGEIHVNSFGQGVDFRSGYAWNWLGFDVSGITNLGSGRGLSEVLYHTYDNNKDRSSVSLGQAALKTKFGDEDLGFEARGGFTPISIGSLGTSGGLHSHAYRGFETKLIKGPFWLGYGWADQFRNEWDDTFRDMYPTWDQNRYTGRGERINYIHSLGGRYAFGPDQAGFIDAGVGEGKNYRRNTQLAISAPVDLGCIGVLTLTGYGILAKHRPGSLTGLSSADIENEYHVSASAQLRTGDWSFMAGMGHTSAPVSGEMNFRLTAWGNSDNRNFIQTAGQLDDFVWDGQNVAKLGANYKIGKKIGLPGLSVGVSYMYGWNTKNQNLTKSGGWELDYQMEYVIEQGRLKGLALGVYAGHLRYHGNRFYGKQDRNDVKVILSYSRTLENFLRQWKNAVRR